MPLSPVVRGTPAGIKLKDGFSSKIAGASNPNISFWEKTVKPPGYSGGEMIDQTTMFNLTWGQKAAQSLIDTKETSGKAAYDPQVVVDIVAMLNLEQGFTIRYRNGDTLSFFGALIDVEFDPLEKGKQPELNYIIGLTNTDPSTGAESGPVFVPATGT